MSSSAGSPSRPGLVLLWLRRAFGGRGYRFMRNRVGGRRVPVRVSTASGRLIGVTGNTVGL